MLKSLSLEFIYLFLLSCGLFSLKEQEVKPGPLGKCAVGKDVRKIEKRDSPHSTQCEGLCLFTGSGNYPKCLADRHLIYRNKKVDNNLWLFICHLLFCMYSSWAPGGDVLSQSNTNNFKTAVTKIYIRTVTCPLPETHPHKMPVATDKERGQDPFLYHNGAFPQFSHAHNSAIPGRVLLTKSKNHRGKGWKHKGTHNHICTLHLYGMSIWQGLSSLETQGGRNWAAGAKTMKGKSWKSLRGPGSSAGFPVGTHLFKVLDAQGLCWQGPHWT